MNPPKIDHRSHYLRRDESALGVLQRQLGLTPMYICHLEEDLKPNEPDPIGNIPIIRFGSATKPTIAIVSKPYYGEEQTLVSLQFIKEIWQQRALWIKDLRFAILPTIKSNEQYNFATKYLTENAINHITWVNIEKHGDENQQPTIIDTVMQFKQADNTFELPKSINFGYANYKPIDKFRKLKLFFQ